MCIYIYYIGIDIVCGWMTSLRRHLEWCLVWGNYSKMTLFQVGELELF